MKYFVIIRVDISIVVNKLSLVVKPGITIRNSFKHLNFTLLRDVRCLLCLSLRYKVHS